jgi:hypothetical protein
VGAALKECLDWIEAEPVDVRARRWFSNGMWAIARAIVGGEWLILWEEDPPDQPVCRRSWNFPTVDRRNSPVG